MKLSFVSGFFYPQEGGVERHLYYLSKELYARSKQYEISVVCSNRTHTGKKIEPIYEEMENIQVYREKALLQKHFLTYCPSMKKRLADIMPDVVHAHSYRHPHIAMASKFAKKFKKRMVFTPYTIFPGSAELPAANIAYYKFYDALFMKKIFKNTDAVVALTHFEKDELVKRGVDASKISVIPCGGYSFDPIKTGNEEKELTPVFEKHKDKFKIGMLARIHPSKGFDVMVKALGLLKDENVVLIFGGKDDGFLDQLMKLATELGVADRIEFVGFVNKYKKQFYEGLDLFVSPSKAEALGMTLVEAQACGVPVIGSDFGPIRETLLNDVTGYNVAYGDHQLLADKIKSLIKDETQRQVFAAKALKRASYFSWKNLTDCMEKVYNGEVCDLYSMIKI